MQGPLHLNTYTEQATLSRHARKHFHCTGTSIPVSGGRGHGAEQGPVPAFRQQPQRRLSRRACPEPPAGPPPSSPSSLPAVGRATCRLGLLLRLLRTRQAGAHEGPGVLLGGELLEAGGGELVHLLLALRPATQRAAVRPGGLPAPPALRGPCFSLTRCGRRRSAGPCARRRTWSRP